MNHIEHFSHFININTMIRSNEAERGHPPGDPTPRTITITVSVHQYDDICLAPSELVTVCEQHPAPLQLSSHASTLLVSWSPPSLLYSALLLP